ncbi:MAG: hypothetical protein AAGA03_14645 [Planctomycetota bacterium]
MASLPLMTILSAVLGSMRQASGCRAFLLVGTLLASTSSAQQLAEEKPFRVETSSADSGAELSTDNLDAAGKIAFRPPATPEDIPGLYPPAARKQPQAETIEQKIDAILGEGVSPDQRRVSELVEQLAAPSFANRERASTELMSLGLVALRQLGKASTSDQDPEVRLRASEIAKQIRETQIESREQEFLTGKSVDFPGWRTTSSILGDSRTVRELFLEMYQAHPEAIGSLDGDAGSRRVQTDMLALRIADIQRTRMLMPRRADLFAILLLAADDQVGHSRIAEGGILSLLNLETTSAVLTDRQLALPLRRLLQVYLPTTDPSNHFDVMVFSIQHGLQGGLGVARAALRESDDIPTSIKALECVCQFGSKEDVETVAIRLTDHRPLTDPLAITTDDDQPEWANSRKLLVSDVARVAIAQLHGVPATELGFKSDVSNSKFGMITDRLDFAIEPEDARKQAKARIAKLRGKEEPDPPASKDYRDV